MNNSFNFEATLYHTAYPMDGNTIFCFDFSVKGMSYLEDFMDICKEDYDIKIIGIDVVEGITVDGREYRDLEVLTDLPWDEFMESE